MEHSLFPHWVESSGIRLGSDTPMVTDPGAGDFIDHTIKGIPSTRHADWVVATRVVIQKVDHLGVMHVLCVYFGETQADCGSPGVHTLGCRYSGISV